MWSTRGSGQGYLYHHHVPSCPVGGGKWFRFHDPFEKVDQLITILFEIYDKACQLHHEHQTHFTWTRRSYVNHKVQSLPIRNGSDLATYSWNMLCCYQHFKPISILGKQYSGQHYSFTIHCFYSDPLSLFHSSKVITFSSVIIQHRRTEIQSIATSFQRKLWRYITWRSEIFLFTTQQPFPLTKFNAKIKACLQIWM